MSRRRWILWWPLLAVSAWLAVSADPPGQAAALSLPTRPVPPSPAPAPAPAIGALPALAPRASLYPMRPDDQQRDLFAARSWKQAVAQPHPPAVPAEPVAPALPYAFIGKQFDGTQWEVFLARGEQSFLVRPGQTLEGSYRVERIEPPVLTLTYLPLGQAQTLQIGAMP